MNTQMSIVALTSVVVVAIALIAILVPGNAKDMISPIITIAAPSIGIFIMLLRTEKMGAEVATVVKKVTDVNQAVHEITNTVAEVSSEVVAVKAQGIETHLQVNSRLDELKTAIGEVEFAKGIEEGVRRALATAIEKQDAEVRNKALGQIAGKKDEQERQALKEGREAGIAEIKAEKTIARQELKIDALSKAKDDPEN